MRLITRTMGRSRLRWTLLVLSVAITAWIISARFVWRGAPVPSNLLLITLDTTRADHLGCYGYGAGQTPNLDSLANSGVLFEHAYSVAPLTLPAHVSLLTGRYPPETGVRRNGRERFDADLPTLAQLLKSKGYDTGAFIASFVLDRKFGLDRGFDHYDDRFSGGVASSGSNEGRRKGSDVVDAALAWLRKSRTSPKFCWVHFYDPHSPCTSHRNLFGDTFSERPYDAEIAYVDRQVGRILNYVRSQGLDKRTLVVVVGDHGEGLGDHQEMTHSLTLYNSTLRVPLLIRQPGRIPAGLRIADNISLVDVFPTILDLMGLSSDARTAGQSFKPAIQGTSTVASPCYSLTEEPFDVYGCSKLRSLTEGRWKFISSTRRELYDLTADPRELENLLDREPQRAEEMATRLADFESQLDNRESSPVALSEAERRSLAGLGYVSGGGAGTTTGHSEQLPDIKDILPLEQDMESAVKLFSEGDAKTAVQLLREIIERAPTHAPAAWSLAWALWSQTKHDEAIAVFRNLLAVRPESSTARYGLGFMLLQRERYDDAISELTQAVELDPQYADAHLRLAEALLAAGQVNESRTHLSEVLTLEPGRLEAVQLLSFIQLNLSRIDAAIHDYRRALRAATEASAKLPPSIQQRFRP